MVPALHNQLSEKVLRKLQEQLAYHSQLLWFNPEKESLDIKEIALEIPEDQEQLSGSVDPTLSRNP